MSDLIESTIVDKVLASLGGEKKIEKDSEFWLFSANEVLVEAVPFFRLRDVAVTVGTDVSLSNPELSLIVSVICSDKKTTRQQFAWHQYKEDAVNSEDVPVVLYQIVKRVIADAQQINIRSVIDSLASNPPGPQSLSQIIHLATLSYKGNIYQLNDYMEGIKSGRRYGFVPMITVEMVEKALDMAIERVANQPDT